MTRVIAEIGLANNSIEWAHTAVEAAADAGCWAIKFQMLTADTIAATDAPRYERLGSGTQHDAFKGALPHHAWREVIDHARAAGLEAFASVWDENAIIECEAANMRFYKIGSADITHLRLLRMIRDTGRKVILSTGAATAGEIDRAVDILGWPILLACTLSYPTAAQDARLERIPWLFEQFGVEVGYSDHTTLIDTSGFAVAAGAEYLEKHFTVTPGIGGDHDFALDPEEMRQYVAHANRAEMLLRHPTPIEDPLGVEEEARLLARRSLHTTTAVAAGEGLVVGVNCRFVRPALDGIAATDPGPWVAARNLPAGARVTPHDVTG